MEIKKCQQCLNEFQITDEDLSFLKEVSPVFAGKKYLIPTPRLCPPCRHQRRLSFRNERKLYTRKCDLSGREIISIYSPDKPYKVYDQPEWWSDKWDSMIYGRDFDFSRNFTDQFRELYEAVPRVSLHTINVENSYYTCYTLNIKNCYLLFGAGNDEDCMYGKYVAYSNDCLDNLCVYSCRFCYQGVASDGCHGCRYFTNCRNCSDSTMIEDCNSCRNCIACFGLRNKEFCFLNEKLSEQKFHEIAKEYEYLTEEKIKFLREKLETLKKDLPHVCGHIYASENCSGDAVYNCKNCISCFDCKDSEDCKYLYNAPKCLKTLDSVYCAPDGLQFCYSVCSCVGTSLMVDYFVWYCDNVFYSMDCLNSRNLFGCVGLRNKQYCIFNKQYTKEEYEKLVPRIIEHMKGTASPRGELINQEWGEFFPFKLAPCAYNETVAMEYFPLNKEQVLKIGATWKDLEDDTVAVSESFSPPDDIRQVNEDICQEILRCEVTGRKYKILPAELIFYKRMKVPVPRRHPDQRHYDRLALHNFYKLNEGRCDKCGSVIQTPYADSKESLAPQRVLCDECYLKTVY